jgi:N-acetylmuramoyl-L-alanine amidase
MTGRASPRRVPRLRLGIVVSIGAILALAMCLPAFAGTISRVTVTPAPSAGPQQLAISVMAADGEPLEPKAFALANPPRLVFDLPGACLADNVPASLPTTVPGIKQVRLGQFSAEPPVARVVVDLADDAIPRYEMRPGDKAGETLIVFGSAGPRALPTPVVRREGDCVLLRLAGVAALTRSVGLLDKPYRIYVDLKNATTRWYEAESREAPLAAIRMGPQEPKDGQPVARIVLELREKQAHSMFADGTDLVIAVGPQPWALPLPAYAPGGRLKGKVIVVDPGHGGNDIGAPATFGSPPGEPYEKDITLDIGRRLTALLKAEGASVTMTRSDDTFVPLQDRAAVANKLKADAFISIHCNSCELPDTLSGTMVFYDHPHSAEFAALVQGELTASLGTADKGVRNANFAVIRRTSGPGILVETAFINHQDDRARLQHPNFQERTARAITQGLIDYLRTTGVHAATLDQPRRSGVHAATPKKELSE